MGLINFSFFLEKIVERALCDDYKFLLGIWRLFIIGTSLYNHNINSILCRVISVIENICPFY